MAAIDPRDEQMFPKFGTADIGRLRPGKLVRLVGYCLQAIVLRFRYGIPNFYYIPAPGMRSAVYRDWLVMLRICERGTRVSFPNASRMMTSEPASVIRPM